MQKARILFICSWYPSEHDSFLGNFIQRHAQAAAQYHQVASLSAHPSERERVEWSEEKGVNEIRVYYRKQLPLLSYHKALKKGYQKLLAEGFTPQLVHLHVVYPAALFALNLKLPLLITEHFSGYHPVSGYRWNAFSKWLTRKALRKSYMVLPVSQHLGRAIKHFAPGISMQKVSNVVDTSVFKPPVQEPSVPEGEAFTFLHISTLEERSKNITGLLQGFKRLEEKQIPFRLWIGGDGNLENLKRKVKAIGLPEKDITLIGPQQSDGVARHMQKADCFVLFSHFENQPCVILEALCCGIPVLSSNVGGIPEEVNRSNGLLCPARDEEAFAEALEKMIRSKPQYRPLSISKDAHNKYGMEAIGAQLNALYLNALNAGT